MSSIFGQPSAEEIERAHQLAESEEFTEEPVGCYQQLLTELGPDATGRIWSLACSIWDRNHPKEVR